MRRIVLGLLLLVFGVAVSVRAADYTKDSLDMVKKGVDDKKALIIDVREPDEWKAGHLYLAISMPLSTLQAGADLKEFGEILGQQIPKDRVLYVHCASGKRCLPAADVLKKFGYDARPLKEGYQQLLQAGLPKAK